MSHTLEQEFMMRRPGYPVVVTFFGVACESQLPEQKTFPSQPHFNIGIAVGCWNAMAVPQRLGIQTGVHIFNCNYFSSFPTLKGNSVFVYF